MAPLGALTNAASVYRYKTCCAIFFHIVLVLLISNTTLTTSKSNHLRLFISVNGREKEMLVTQAL